MENLMLVLSLAYCVLLYYTRYSKTFSKFDIKQAPYLILMSAIALFSAWFRCYEGETFWAFIWAFCFFACLIWIRTAYLGGRVSKNNFKHTNTIRPSWGRKLADSLQELMLECETEGEFLTITAVITHVSDILHAEGISINERVKRDMDNEKKESENKS